MIVAVSFLLAAGAAPACLPVSGERIVAADLAAAIPEFGAVDPRTPFGYAPSPGATRVLRVGDVERFARQVGVELEDEYRLCFAWELRPVPPSAYEEAMRKALGRSDVEIKILQLSGYPAPPGELVFDAAALTAPSGGDPTAPTLWRGHVEYGQDRKFAVWARVQLVAEMQRVVAAVPLRAGEPIPKESLRLETYRGFPRSGEVVGIEEAAGSILLRPLTEGATISKHLLRPPLHVRRGDLVEVTVESGPAVIRTDGVAEGSGRAGETIAVRNPNSGKSFRARISGPGKVHLRMSGG